MKRLISGILCTALVATCLCGCGKSSDEEKDNKKDIEDKKETLYLLKEVVQKNDAGEVLRRDEYEYTNKGLVTTWVVDQPVTHEWWDDAEGVYVYESGPCDGEIDFEYYFTYDKHGSITHADGEIEGYREYTYDKSGRVTGFDYYDTDDEGTKKLLGRTELSYKMDGTIEMLNSTWQWRTSNGRVTSLEWTNSERAFHQYFFEYDKNGKMTEYQYYCNNELYQEGNRTYDAKGRVTQEVGVRHRNRNDTYEYDGDRLVSFNGVELKYREKQNGELVVTYENYELTYEPVELTKAEITTARSRWNQLVAGYANSIHSIYAGINGVESPLFDSNTELLLPKVIYDATE